MSLMVLVARRWGGETVQGPVHKPSRNTQQLGVRVGNGSQQFSSLRMGQESLGIRNSPVTQVLCIYLPLSWLQNAVTFHSGLLERQDSGKYVIPR